MSLAPLHQCMNELLFLGRLFTSTDFHTALRDVYMCGIALMRPSQPLIPASPSYQSHSTPLYHTGSDLFCPTLLCSQPNQHNTTEITTNYGTLSDQCSSTSPRTSRTYTFSLETFTSLLPPLLLLPRPRTRMCLLRRHIRNN